MATLYVENGKIVMIAYYPILLKFDAMVYYEPRKAQNGWRDISGLK